MYEIFICKNANRIFRTFSMVIIADNYNNVSAKSEKNPQNQKKKKLIYKKRIEKKLSD